MTALIRMVFALGLVSFVTPASADLKSALFQKIQREHQGGVHALGPTTPRIFQQTLDHGTLNSPKFAQRYWIDSRYAAGPNSPVLYEICGEATCQGTSLRGPIYEQARRLRAHLVALEHRYYGYSVPFPTLESANLRYLSIHQAIEDLATFQRYARTQLRLRGKWIAIGGSYAGSLAAYYRQKHPELVVGALASSAPVQAKADFFEYDRHITQVAGPACVAKMLEAVAEVERRIDGDPAIRQATQLLFHAEMIRDPRDFLYTLADMASIAIQYGQRDRFCDAIEATSTIDELLSVYAEVGTEMFTWFGITAEQDSFQGAESTNPADYISGAGSRAWLYQSCTEYGYWQIADRVSSSRSNRITQSYHDEVCARLFGILTPVDTARTNRTYFDPLFSRATTHIFFTNGSDDPWSTLSILEGSSDATRNPNLDLMTILGAAHCDDLVKVINGAYDRLTILIQRWLL